MTDHLRTFIQQADQKITGQQVYDLVGELYPFCRSITGDGLRRSLKSLQKCVPLVMREVPTGTQVFDWTVPKEWNIRDAYIKNSKGERLVDFQQSNLHVVNYSIPVKRRVSRAELKEHVFTLPQTPELIPYRTSYYKETWGFCLKHRQWESMPEDEYEVCIDSSLEPGNLTFGEFRVQGETDDEVIISAHSCHPSLCNDNLSSMAVAAKVAQIFAGVGALRYSYRFLWVPATIGTIAWFSLNEAAVPRIKHGLVLSCVGDPGKFTYKRSRRGNAEIDRAMEHCLRLSGDPYEVRDFTPYGCDERQYCSPGFNLAVGCLMRTPNEEYPENHTSADNLQFVTSKALGESVLRILSVLEILEKNDRYVNLHAKCEPHLGRRGLYGQMGGKGGRIFTEAIMWTLNLSDGEHTLLDIAERANLQFGEVAEAARVLSEHELLRRLPADEKHRTFA
jgi:aminopeptidase-like protein